MDCILSKVIWELINTKIIKHSAVQTIKIVMAFNEIKITNPNDKSTEKQVLLITDEQKHLTKLFRFWLGCPSAENRKKEPLISDPYIIQRIYFL